MRVQFLCQRCSLQLAYRLVEGRRDVIWSHLCILREEKWVCGDSLMLFVKSCLTKFSNYFISYLMQKYELITFSIIIILPTPDRDWDGTTACHAKPHGRRVISLRSFFFLRSAFIEIADQTSKRDYRPIAIGSRSIGAPFIFRSLVSGHIFP